MQAKLTPRTHQQIIAAIAAGALPSDAAHEAGTTYASVSRWLRLGKGKVDEGHPAHPYARFRSAYFHARELARSTRTIAFAPEFLALVDTMDAGDEADGADE